jgi:hypothetical protein
MVKRQMFRSGIALLAVLLALVFAGCDSDTDDTEKSTNTTLISIKIGSGDAAPFYTDHPAESVAAITKCVEFKLSNSDKTGAAVTLTPGGNFKGKMEIAKVGKGGGASAQFAPYAAGTTSFTFEHENEIYIKMTAEDGKTIRYYGVIIEIGADAGLKSIKVGNDAVENDELGTPANTLAGVTAPGRIMMTQPQPAAGFAVVVTPNDADAKVSFGKGDADSSWAEGKQQTIHFEDEDFIGVKVVSQNDLTINYYKIIVELMPPAMEIPYGTPDLGTGDFVDSKWGEIAWIDVQKQNRSETTQEFYDDPSTKGKAKLFWDAEGLWLYVDVEGPLSTNTGYAHEGSSVELFINEAYPSVTSGNYNNIGGQYRLDSNGVTSGDPTVAVSAMDTLNKFKAFKKTDGSGYFVMFQAPWRFASTYILADNKKISLEIQINAANRSGTGRIGVLKWYNTTANTYQNASALAEGVLKLNGKDLPTQKPGIITQSVRVRVPLNGIVPALTVEAKSPDDGILSYQWYRSATATNTGGTLQAGATNASYTPVVSTTAPGEFFFYVVVTNTKNGSPATTVSDPVRVLVFDPAVTPDDIKLVNSSHPNWNAAANALVIDNGTSFGGNNSFATIVELPIPATTDLAKFVRLEFDLDTYENGVIVPIPASQWSNNIAYTLIDGAGTQVNQEYNGGPGYVWNLTDAQKAADFSGGQGIVRITAGNKTNAVDKVVVRSVIFFVED